METITQSNDNEETPINISTLSDKPNQPIPFPNTESQKIQKSVKIV